MLGILIGAAILGGIIMAMEEGEFPGWRNMVICVLAAVAPGFVFRFAAPELWWLGLVLGAVFATIAISATVGMTIQRAAIAALIWLAIQIVISFALNAMFQTVA